MMSGNSRQPLATLGTPCLILDESRMSRNIARLRERLASTGVTFRPHIKTAKCLEIARRMMPHRDGPATVSTLREVEVLADFGVRDILYAVGIAPDKLDRVAAIRRRGVDLSILCDSIEQAEAICAKSLETGEELPTFIEIDTGGHRAGIPPQDERLLAVGRVLNDCGALQGVLAHAGESYNASAAGQIERIAENERAGAVAAARRLRDAGLACTDVSIGSTPTAHTARELSGVTEVRAGVYVFFDLVMAGIGVCTLDDIAISVLTTVIGHRADKGGAIIDAGWMALSRDRGTAKQAIDQGYGVVCDASGRPFPDLIVLETSQEHGIVGVRAGAGSGAVAVPIGTRLRILPNHACAMGAQHERYHVIDHETSQIIDVWPRFRGW